MTDRFRDAMQRCLDTGTDPLADPAVREHLEAHPGDLEAFAALTASLRALRRVGGTAARPAIAAPRIRWRRRAAATVAVALLAAASFVALQWLPPTNGMPPPPRTDPRGRFVAVSCSLPVPARLAPPRVHAHVVTDRTWRMTPADDFHRAGTFTVAVLRMQTLEN